MSRIITFFSYEDLKQLFYVNIPKKTQLSLTEHCNMTSTITHTGDVASSARGGTTSRQVSVALICICQRADGET